MGFCSIFTDFARNRTWVVTLIFLNDLLFKEVGIQKYILSKVTVRS